MSEILLIFLVALIVIRPERLPELAYGFGCLLNVAKKQISKLKAMMHDIMHFKSSQE